MGETSLTEVPRLPATSGARSGRLAGPASWPVFDRSPRPGRVTAPDPRTTTEDRLPLGALGAPGPGPRDVSFVSSFPLSSVVCLQLSARRARAQRAVLTQPPCASRAFRSAHGSG